MDSRPVRFRGECTENQSVCCTTELCLSVDKLKTKKKTSTGNQLLKLRILTPLLDWKRCSKALSRHHSSVVTIFVTRTIQDSKSKFLRERLCSQSIEIFREDICSVCSSCPLDSQIDVSLISTVVLQSIVFRCAGVRLVPCAV